ncbi:MAG: (2Fe-2S)-binding protein [Candidatus Binatia bacterium]|jgi:aerobic-type carbon monoxide dehydrogenase small subunit (CoxS/CutS family)|nr:(2Fe-2S)-binding protein [Candidatus Binatia bacterium]
MKHTLLLRINGREEKLEAEDGDTLLEVLRSRLQLWSVREGCGVGACGTCTVLIDGRPLSSCLLLAIRVEGKEITTVEGLAGNGELDPIQKAFMEQRGVQCGYCTPGFILAVKALLSENPDPTDDEAREYLAGNLCRCGGYTDILRSVRAVQDKIKRPARP